MDILQQKRQEAERVINDMLTIPLDELSAEQLQQLNTAQSLLEFLDALLSEQEEGE